MGLQTLEDIGEVLYYATAFNPRYWVEGTATSVSKDELLQAVRELFALLHQRGISYALVGGIALLHYVEGRNAQDLAFLLPVEDLEKIPEIVTTYRDVYFARGRYKGLQVDLLFTSNPLFRRVKEKYVRWEKFQGVDVPVATVEGLLLLKMYALPSLYRQGDFARVSLYENDIAMLMYAYEPDIERLLREVGMYLSQGEREALQDIIQEIRARVQRFREESAQGLAEDTNGRGDTSS